MIRFLSILTIIFSLISCKSTKKHLNKENIVQTTQDNMVRDGSSFKKAIIVNSIHEEYEYIKANCIDCSLKGQALIFVNKQPFDMITVIQPDGKEIKYYFDIHKFYGKW